jgi:thiamine-monophosphate kinase
MPRLTHTENSLLARIEKRFRNSAERPSNANKYLAISNQVSLGIGDDAALFRPTPGCETILTCDWFLEGSHFLRHKHPADSVGWKCLARAISDIAAMGGAPRCFLMSLALPATSTGEWLTGFLGGLRRAAKFFDCPLAGGDTTRRNQILINITVVGEVKRGRALRRDGANAGDIIFVSGRLGEAERGLQLLRKRRGVADHNAPQLRKHLYPEPRLALAQWLAEKRLATSAMDLSDGLSSDLPRLCAASRGVGARIDAAKLPTVNLGTSRINRATTQNRAQDDESLDLALNGGDDYELLFTVPEKSAAKIPPKFEGLPLQAIGEITKTRQLLLASKTGASKKLKPAGWDPFR